MATQNAEIMSIEQLANYLDISRSTLYKLAQARKIDALRQHKKGLMQRLFPMPAEVGA